MTPANTGDAGGALVVQRTYDLLLWLLPKVETFPRSYRFTLGDRIATSGLDLLLALLDAAYARSKAAPLGTAATRVNALRYLLRLSKDLKLLSGDSYLFGSERLDEIGRMVGGWRKSAGVS